MQRRRARPGVNPQGCTCCSGTPSPRSTTASAEDFFRFFFLSMLPFKGSPPFNLSLPPVKDIQEQVQTPLSLILGICCDVVVRKNQDDYANAQPILQDPGIENAAFTSMGFPALLTAHREKAQVEIVNHPLGVPALRRTRIQSPVVGVGCFGWSMVKICSSVNARVSVRVTTVLTYRPPCRLGLLLWHTAQDGPWVVRAQGLRK